MTLTPGTRLGVYEITAPIGEGGMGQVFRALVRGWLRPHFSPHGTRGSAWEFDF